MYVSGGFSQSQSHNYVCEHPKITDLRPIANFRIICTKNCDLFFSNYAGILGTGISPTKNVANLQPVAEEDVPVRGAN